MNPFAEEVARCRRAQFDWSQRSIRDRLKPVREFRHLLVERTAELAAAVLADVRRPQGELIATDLIPTASAAKYLERRAATILAPRAVGDRPLWLMGCRDTIHRRPRGLVGVIGTWNYPVFLNAVPILHALVAGNGILWKPSEHAPRTADVLKSMFFRAGFPPDLVQLLPATREAGPDLANATIDFLHFTGSESVGRTLAARLGERLVPSALELSGCDAMFVLDDADVPMAATLAWYGATLNSGQTCMAVRRALIARSRFEEFVDALRPLAHGSSPVSLLTEAQTLQRDRIVAEALEAGCEIVPAEFNGRPAVIVNARGNTDLAANREAVFAPLLTVTPFDTLDDALAIDSQTDLRLTASIMTDSPSAARQFAARLNVGSVVVNDVIVPTAHPATPFGGRGASGWGVSQGREGLLEMTVPQVVTVRKGRFRPHAESGRSPHVPPGYFRLVHGRGWRERLGGLRQLLGRSSPAG